MNRRIGWPLIAIVALSALVISTQVDGPPRTNADRVRALSEDFACPTCDGQSIAESNAVVAQEIRRDISRQVDDGATDEQITERLIASYDESIDLRPRSSGLVGLVWVLPVAAMVLGMGGLAAVFRRWQQRPNKTASPEDEEMVAALREQRQ